MHCRDFRELADSYLSDELLVETNHDVIAHLQSCAECRRELSARRELRATLRASFANAEELRLRDEFAFQLQNHLRIAATSGAMSIRGSKWLIAAGLIFVVTFGVIVQLQRQRTRTAAQVAVQRQDQNTDGQKISDVQPRPPDLTVDANLVLAKMFELAAGDHRNCAIGHRLPDPTIPLEEGGRKYDRAYLNLAEAVLVRRGEFPDPIELVMAHACKFKGQWFGHIVVKYRGRLVSILVTRLESPGATALAKEKLPKAQEAQVIACSTAGGYHVSCFRTVQHVVFVVSDLEEGENLTLARAVAPSVYEHITQAEHIT